MTRNVDPKQDAEPQGADPDAVRRAIRGRAERIEERELEKAFTRLDAHGGLDAQQRRIIEEMATEIVREIIAAPESALADPAHDEAAIRTAIELFDPSGEAAAAETGSGD